MKLNPFNTKIGLALGGGAAKGIAHIGVLKAFEEEKVKIIELNNNKRVLIYIEQVKKLIKTKNIILLLFF